jgi:ABC-type glycerol-3-phosphate transport system substrate-binding protein
MDNEASVQTMLWYVPLVAGPSPIGNNLGGGQILTKAVEDGYLLCLVTPDWRSKGYENDISRVSGKMALMPLPAVKPGGPRTTTWGGTMVGITKKSKHPELAWELAKFFYLNTRDLAARFLQTNILPPVPAAWKNAAFHKKRAYWSNQALGDEYAKLAPLVPFQYTSPFIPTAKSKLGEALATCVQYYNAHGPDGFEPYVRRTLASKANDIRRLTERNPF